MKAQKLIATPWVVDQMTFTEGRFTGMLPALICCLKASAISISLAYLCIPLSGLFQFRQIAGDLSIRNPRCKICNMRHCKFSK